MTSSKLKGLHPLKKSPHDVVYTPVELAKEIIAACAVDDGDTILDPFRGGGAFYDNYPQHALKDWCEIEEGRDFMNYDKKVDWIISNPPFSKLNQHIPKMCQVATKGICIIMGCLNLTHKRDMMFQDMGFKLVHEETFLCRSWFGFRACFLIYRRDKETSRRLSKIQW